MFWLTDKVYVPNETGQTRIGVTVVTGSTDPTGTVEDADMDADADRALTRTRRRRARKRRAAATSASYSITMRLHTDVDPAVVGRVATASRLPAASSPRSTSPSRGTTGSWST